MIDINSAKGRASDAHGHYSRFRAWNKQRKQEHKFERLERFGWIWFFLGLIPFLAGKYVDEVTAYFVVNGRVIDNATAYVGMVAIVGFLVIIGGLGSLRKYQGWFVFTGIILAHIFTQYWLARGYGELSTELPSELRNFLQDLLSNSGVLALVLIGSIAWAAVHAPFKDGHTK